MRVVPTRSLPQGIAALLAFNYEADLEANVRADGPRPPGRVASIEVTRAVRDADVDGQHVEAGQCARPARRHPRRRRRRPTRRRSSARSRRTEPERREIVTIYWGDGASRDAGRALREAILAAHPHLEVEVAEGGQPHYPYILSVE